MDSANWRYSAEWGGGNVNGNAGDKIDERVAQEDGDVINDVPWSKSTLQQW